MEFKLRVNEELKTLTDDSGMSIFVGRSKQIHEKYGREGALLLGTLAEEEGYGKFVYLDAIAPHVIFVVGSRGSGKSYSLGIMAEELVTKNPNVACIIIDPLGIYWSMKYPNQDEAEVDALVRMGLMPKGIDKVKVFVPYGVKKRLPKGTYDATFAIRPADLTVDDWCLTFDIDRFSPTGLLLEKVLAKVRDGYKTLDGKKIPPKQEVFGLDDIINCLENDNEIASAKKGFKADSRRALVSRFEAAKGWGVFTHDGTSLIELAREGEISVIDTSFLEENVSSLIIGILARKILEARKLAARNISMRKFSDIEELEANIPPVWLFIDEAHTLIPSGGRKTPATDPLTEYVKQGRRPGCSLVFATQQPGAIDTHVLSQLDIILCHKLVFDDDIKAVMKRIPTMIPPECKSPRFIKTIPIGHCLLGDRSDTTNRLFAVKIRPRYSQHEGRETRSVSSEEPMTQQQVFETLIKMVKKHIADRHRIHEKTLKQIVSTVNKRYRVKIDPADVVTTLLGEGYVSDGGYIALEREISPEEDETQKLEKPPESAIAFSPIVTKERARGLVDKIRKKKFLGFFGSEEKVEKEELEYWPIVKVSYQIYKEGGYKKSVCYVDGMTGELLFMDKGRIQSTKGLSELTKLDRNERGVVIALRKGKKASARALAAAVGITDSTANLVTESLVEKGFLGYEKTKKGKYYYLAKNMQIPETIDTLQFSGLEAYLLISDLKAGKLKKGRLGNEYVKDIPEIFGEAKIEDISKIYYPVYKFTLTSGTRRRVIYVNGLTGSMHKGHVEKR